MSHFLDRLKFFEKNKESFSNDHGVVTNEDRQWEVPTVIVGRTTRSFAPRTV